MKKYECVLLLQVDRYDEDGLLTGEPMEIDKGTQWYVDEDTQYNFVAGSDAIRLVQITDSNNVGWIEIYQDTLDDHFVSIL